MPYAARRHILGAAALRSRGLLGEAEGLCRKALELQEEALGPRDPAVAATLVKLASVCRDQDRLTEAEAVLVRAVSIAEQHHDPKSPRSILSTLARYLLLLGWVLQEQGRWEDAEEHLRRAGGTEGLFLLAKGCYAQGLDEGGGSGQRRLEEAEHLYRHCLRRTRLPEPLPPHPGEPHLLEGLSEALHARGRYREAEAVHRRANEVRFSLGPDPKPYPWLWHAEWSVGE